MANQQSFMKDMQGYAMSAGAVLDIPYQVILAQWAHESTYGTSSLAQRANNFAGIKYTSNADYKDGGYSGYNSIARFTQDYIRVMKLPAYQKVREASGIRETIIALGNSPYAEDSQYATKLLSMVDINDTSQGVVGNLGAVANKAVNVLSSPFLWLVLFLYFLIKR